AAQHGEHLRCRIERGEPMPAPKPAGDRFAQGGRSCRCGIICEPGSARCERIENELRSRLLWLANREADGAAPRGRHDPGEELAQPLERIRLEERELGIQCLEFEWCRVKPGPR